MFGIADLRNSRPSE